MSDCDVYIIGTNVYLLAVRENHDKIYINFKMFMNVKYHSHSYELFPNFYAIKPLLV